MNINKCQFEGKVYEMFETFRIKNTSEIFITLFNDFSSNYVRTTIIITLLLTFITDKANESVRFTVK